MATPHIEAKKGEIAKTVLMPGDPLRAKVVAETFLENVKLVNGVRNILAFTGTYQSHPVTVMASGMGMPSIGIYSYELFTEYDVDAIIRIGSAGAYAKELKIYDVVLASSVWSESSYARTQNGSAETIMLPSQSLNQKIIESAKRLDIPVTETRVHSSDVFYRQTPDAYQKIYQEQQCTCVEMESFALFHNANVLQKQAACLLTISDSFVSHEVTTPEERQTSFTNMMKVALEASM